MMSLSPALPVPLPEPGTFQGALSLLWGVPAPVACSGKISHLWPRGLWWIKPALGAPREFPLLGSEVQPPLLFPSCSLCQCPRASGAPALFWDTEPGLQPAERDSLPETSLQSGCCE